MSLGQSVRKFVAKFIPKKRPKVVHSTITLPEPVQNKMRPLRTRPHSWWLHRRSRLRMTNASRRSNR